MSDILKITQLVNPKNYTSASRPLAQSDAVFDLVDLSKVIKTNDRTKDFRQTENSTTEPNPNFIADMELNISKSPSFSTSLLKGILSDDFVSQILQSGSPEVINEFNEFAKNIFLQGDGIAADLATQQKGATSFNGELFDIIRTLSAENNTPEVKSAIAQFLKSTFTLQSQNSLITSLSINFAYLSSALFPSKNLSEQLFAMAEQLAKPDSALNFTQLKEEALKLLNQVSNSLIATDKIKNLVSLVKYNISRFNDNPDNLEKAFENMLRYLPEGDLKAELKEAFLKFIQGNSIPELTKRALNSHNQNYAETDNTTFKLSDMAKEFTQNISTEKFNTELNTIAQQLAKLIDNNGKHPTISLGDATASLKDMLNLILPQNAEKELSQFLQNFNETKDLNALVNRLSYMLNNIDSYEIKSSLSQLMNNLLTALSNSDDVVYNQPSSMDYLSAFLSKTLNNENIVHLGIVEPHNLVHSMLTAPGVFTPLLHYVLPVKIGDVKAFGEVWIDNKTIETGEKSDSNHIFISFDIENVGVFELEMQTDKNNLNVNLYCPHGLEKYFSTLKPQFAEVAKRAGYSINSSSIRPLTKVRNLVEVFPRIAERRSGLNVKI